MTSKCHRLGGEKLSITAEMTAFMDTDEYYPLPLITFISSQEDCDIFYLQLISNQLFKPKGPPLAEK